MSQIPNKNLQRLRVESGLSQLQLGEAADMNFRVLQSYEQGHRDISGAKLATLLKICLTLKCKLSDIVTDEETKTLLGEYEQLV